ncbi:hypothetical protein BDF21DRAFT_432166 [Thamnidium elegans]|nr:hypothetical protein BDF21DRAFT_432166 [Thamnidium elegans]
MARGIVWMIAMGSSWQPLEPTASTEAERIWNYQGGEYVRSNLFTAGSVIFINIPAMMILYGNNAYTIARTWK